MKKLTQWLLGIMFLASLSILSCQKEVQSPLLTSEAEIIEMLDAPTVSCAVCAVPNGPTIAIQVYAGASGAPAGFSVQWMLKSEFDANGGWPATDPVGSSSFCKASFSGVPADSYFDLAPLAGAEINIGDYPFDQIGASSTCANTPLLCGQEYVFRAMAHNVQGGLGESNWSANTICSTTACVDPGCTFTQGYWKTHGPSARGNNTNVWPVNSLTLGTVNYTAAQLQSIFDKSPAGNGLITLAHQLIAAKLNVAKGAAPAAVSAAIASADAMIGGLVIPPAGAGSLAPGSVSSLVTTLTNYNEGITGPGHCE